MLNNHKVDAMSNQTNRDNGTSGRQPHFKVSSLCGAGECIAVAQLADGRIAVRDNKDLSLAPMIFTKDEWLAFIGGVKNGEFDVH